MQRVRCRHNKPATRPRENRAGDGPPPRSARPRRDRPPIYAGVDRSWRHLVEVQFPHRAFMHRGRDLEQKRSNPEKRHPRHKEGGAGGQSMSHRFPTPRRFLRVMDELRDTGDAQQPPAMIHDTFAAELPAAARTAGGRFPRFVPHAATGVEMGRKERLPGRWWQHVHDSGVVGETGAVTP